MPQLQGAAVVYLLPEDALRLQLVVAPLRGHGNEVLPHYATKEHSAPVEKAVSGG